MRATSHVAAALLALTTVAAPALAAAEVDPVPARRSPAVATALAAAPVAAGIGLAIVAEKADNDALGTVAVGSLVVGPSLGHFYAGAWGRGIATTGTRVAGLGLMAAGVFMGFGACDWDASANDPCRDSERRAMQEGRVVMAVGGAMFVAATVYDIVDAPRAAHRFNERFSVTPTMVSGAAGNAPGLAVAGRF